MPFPPLIIVALAVASGPGPVGLSAPPQSPAPQAAAPQAAAVPKSPSAVIPFSSNGCSGFREATFFSCCFAHDLSYWAGGTWSDRSKSDRALWNCVFTISGERVVADIGYLLVRLGIVPGAFLKDGWGRAWYNTKRSRYAPLTPDQQQVVEAERTRVCQSLRLNSTNGWYFVDDKREIRARQARDICGGEPPVRR